MNDQELDEFEQRLRVLHAAAHAEIAESTDVADELLAFKRHAYAEAAEATTTASGTEVRPERAALVATTELLLRMSLNDETQMPRYAYRDVVRVVSGRRPSLRSLVSAAGFAGLFSGMGGMAAALTVGDRGSGWFIVVTVAVVVLVLVCHMWLASIVAKTDAFTIKLRVSGREFALVKAPGRAKTPSAENKQIIVGPSSPTPSVRKPAAFPEIGEDGAKRWCFPSFPGIDLATRRGTSKSSY